MPSDDMFQQGTAASSGALTGDYLWSNPGNWVSTIPVAGDTVVTRLAGYDDLAVLSLASLIESNGGIVRVTGGDLSVGTVEGGAGDQLAALGAVAGATISVVVTIGSLVGGGGLYAADGATSSLIDNSASDPGATYTAENGGTVVLAAAPADATVLSFGGLGTGTIALDNPNPLNAGLLLDLAQGDVLELPGTSVSSVSFGTTSLTVITDTGTYAFSDVVYFNSVTDYTAKFDAATGLEAITFAGPDDFQQAVAASSGVLNGDYLWSNPANWTTGLPIDGDGVTISSTGVDDLAALRLTSLSELSGGIVRVTGGVLDAGTVVGGAGTQLSASGVLDGATTPVVVTIGTVTAGNGLYGAAGATSRLVDNSPVDLGATYIAEDGGTVVLSAAPSGTSELSYGGSGTGTIALDNPNAINGALLLDIAQGDVLELPGTSVGSVSFSTSGLTAITDMGTYAFDNVVYFDTVSGYTTQFDTATGLEAITFAGPDTFQQVSKVTSGALNGFYLWSNPANWSNGVPANGVSASVTTSVLGVDDIAALSLASLTETNAAVVDVIGSDLNVGTLVAGTGTQLFAAGIEAGANMPVTVTVGTIIGAGGSFGATGQMSSFVDNATTDPGGTYSAMNGGTVVLSAAPAITSALVYGSAADNTGTIALLNPNPVTLAELENVAPGDVLELPGTSVISFSGFVDGTSTVTTNTGAYSFVVNDPFAVLGPSVFTSFDTAIGLAAISFTGPPETFQQVASDLWSNPANWISGNGNAIPVNGDIVTVPVASVDDLPALSLANLTDTAGGGVEDTGGVLNVGTLAATPGPGLAAFTTAAGGTANVTVTVGAVIGAGGTYAAVGPGSTFVDNSAADPGGTYAARSGGTVVLSGGFASTSTLEFDFATAGTSTNTIELDQPNAINAALLDIAPGDVLELPGTSVSSVDFGAVSLTVTTSAGAYEFEQISEVNPANSYSAAFDGATGLEAVTFSALCFCEGSLIRTPSGDIPVERLGVGDTVVTRRCEAMPITWIGRGRVLATRGHRNAATPVIVRKGALAENVPYADLRLTKGHSFFIDGALIPVEFLVNHRSIVWDDRAREVSIFHVELATHDVLLANGAPAESYRDDGNRWMFRNANTSWGLLPQEPYAPVLTGGPIVDAIWRRLLDRAGPRPGLPTTDDADLHLLVDGQRVDVARCQGNARVFRLRTAPAIVRVASRASVPAELGLARDPRVLGVALRQIAVWKGVRLAVTEADDSRLTDGFHDYEPDAGLRWTNGDAHLPPGFFAGFVGPLNVVLHLAGTTRYLLSADKPARTAA